MCAVTGLSVSLIATVRNEIGALDQWLAGIERQTRQPDEVVIVDGGSTDGTLERLQEWASNYPARIISAPGASISAGRNLAFRHATGDILAITDCGTIARIDWLERITAPFSDPDVDVVSGFFVPNLGSMRDRALAAATLPDVEEIDSDRFLPSSRSVALRATWTRAGFTYSEWLDYCEDLIWDMQLKRAGARFTLAEDAIVTFSVRPDVRAFWKQYFLYARGDGKAGLFAKRHLVRYGTYLAAATVLARRRPIELLLLVVAGMFHVWKPVRRLMRRDRDAGIPLPETIATLPLVPLQMVIGDLAKMAGYPVGLKWRLDRFGSLRPSRDWRRITGSGEMWHLPATEKRPTDVAADS